VIFECQQCGACCYGDWWDPGTIGLFLSDEEISRISLATGQPADSFMATRHNLQVHPWCGLYDPETKLCIAHDVKPTHCTKWPLGFSQLKRPDTLAKAARLCPGITLEPGDLPSVSTD
jgi:Fe-S-cluster containining protein